MNILEGGEGKDWATVIACELLKRQCQEAAAIGGRREKRYVKAMSRSSQETCLCFMGEKRTIGLWGCYVWG